MHPDPKGLGIPKGCPKQNTKWIAGNGRLMEECGQPGCLNAGALRRS